MKISIAVEKDGRTVNTMEAEVASESDVKRAVVSAMENASLRANLYYDFTISVKISRATAMA